MRTYSTSDANVKGYSLVALFILLKRLAFLSISPRCPS
jgi:hypothetical protein